MKRSRASAPRPPLGSGPEADAGATSILPLRDRRSPGETERPWLAPVARFARPRPCRPTGVPRAAGNSRWGRIEVCPHPARRGTFRAGPRFGGRIALLLALLLLPLAAAPILAQSGRGAIDARQRELSALKKQITENRKKIQELERKEKKLGDLNGRLRRDRDLTIRYLAELEKQEQAILLDIGERQKELGAKTSEQEKTKELLRRRLRLYQRSRRPHTAELLLSSESFPELFARGAVLARAIQRDRADLLWVSQQREEISLAASALESRHRDITALQEEKQREKDRLESRSRKTRAELTSLQKELSAFEARQRELVKAEKQISSLLARLEAERKKAVKDNKGQKIQGKGQFPWPVQGKLVGRFGLEKHPRFGTKVPNKGIDISAPAGTPVTAVAKGSVAFADWLPGYGRCVIINHGGGLYTLYAHCARLLVTQGASVPAGGRIAEVGDTDSVKGTCLHFEVRQGEEAMDPLRWLR